jgi:dTDP-4-amino-4,6-dideoxygalactose transaminase
MKLRLQYGLYRKFFSPRLYWPAVNMLRIMSRFNIFVGSSQDDELAAAEPLDKDWRMSAFQARVGLKHLKNLDHDFAHRRRLMKFYSESLLERGWELPEAPAGSDCTLLRFPLEVGNKQELLQKAERARIEIGSWFETALHPINKSLERFGYQVGQCPVGEHTANRVVNLPLHKGVSLVEAERIVEFFVRHSQRPYHSSLVQPTFISKSQAGKASVVK